MYERERVVVELTFIRPSRSNCRPRHLCSTAVLHYNSVLSHILPTFTKKLQLLRFGYDTYYVVILIIFQLTVQPYHRTFLNSSIVNQINYMTLPKGNSEATFLLLLCHKPRRQNPILPQSMGCEAVEGPRGQLRSTHRN